MMVRCARAFVAQTMMQNRTNEAVSNPGDLDLHPINVAILRSFYIKIVTFKVRYS